MGIATSNGSTSSNDGAKLLLRVLLGVLILLHGIAKLKGGVPTYVMDLVARVGLPAVLGYLVFIGEVVAPILLIIGLWTRLAALVIAINMIAAIALVHSKDLFAIAKSGGWALELQGMFLFVAIAIAMLGAGRYSVGGANGRWN
jgi:putative oxidoreductase